MIVGDSEDMPFDDATFDAITVSFGVRNFANLAKGIREIARVLKPTGVLVILETSNPVKFPFKQGYKLYTNLFLPVIGKLFSKDKDAYSYLSASANSFPFGDAFNNILQKNGFTHTKHTPVTFGVATIYIASK
jgi:demethylmenaquinone methyltransferase/2-methoxy-6-polyprenyl-1,4-benzoquinol methylase